MNYVLETQELTKMYGNTTVVNRVSMHVPEGKIYGLLGRNGAGKTTTMKMLLRMIRITNGKVVLFGKEKNNRKDYQKIGSIIETPGFYKNLSGEENLKLLARLHQNVSGDDVRRALETVGLDREGKKQFASYSLGMKQRLGIAAAIMHHPSLLILDEPINGLDPIGIVEVRSFLRKLSEEEGVTILLSSHILNEIEQIADVIGVMDKSNLVEEVALNTLRDNLKSYIDIRVSDIKRTEQILREQFKVEKRNVCNNVIRISDSKLCSDEIIRKLVEAKVSVYELKYSEDSLENYFETLIGGNGIA